VRAVDAAIDIWVSGADRVFEATEMHFVPEQLERYAAFANFLPETTFEGHHRTSLT
jgi:hypothetical protein